MLSEAGVTVYVTHDKVSDWTPRYGPGRLALSLPSITEPLPERLLHELSHLQVCPEWRRRLADYGLGREYLGGERRSPLISERRAYSEETAAQIMTAAWLKDLAPSERWHDYLRRVGMCRELLCTLDLQSHFAPNEPVGKLAHNLKVLAHLLDDDMKPQPRLGDAWRIPRGLHKNRNWRRGKK
ncbi:MAG: hypothetical protein D6812_04490 [Deltaproteobacteria bacterium]|nr:MAG: hypothetical protein D6812_04490 [Deltaproteobacteria bacterium]